jgi:hypothetical protein
MYDGQCRWDTQMRQWVAQLFVSSTPLARSLSSMTG